MQGSKATFLAVNLGRPSTIEVGGERVPTGIFKSPVEGPVEIDVDGLAGDAVADRRHHGGPDQAIYLYSAEDAAWWADELGRPVPPGFFGENLTIDRWWPAPRVGDRLRAGELVLELTAPRIPCAKLAERMGGAPWLRAFVGAGRPGAYARVLAPGKVEAGLGATVTGAPEANPTILALYQLWHSAARDRESMQRWLAAPLAERARAALEFWLREGG